MVVKQTRYRCNGNARTRAFDINNSEVKTAMLARPKLTRPEQPVAEKQKTQGRPVDERFLLRVDGQIKRSFSSKDSAMTAGSKIKRDFPIVVVTIVDTEDAAVDLVKA